MTWRTPKYTGPERRKAERWRPQPLRVLLFLLAVVAMGYTVAVLSLVNQESTLVLEAGRTLGDARPAFPYTQIDVPRKDAARQFAWVMTGPADEGAWVLYLHGNASTIASPVNISHYREFRTIGLNVLAPNIAGLPVSMARRRRPRSMSTHVRRTSTSARSGTSRRSGL